MAHPTAVCMEMSDSRQNGLSCCREDILVLRMLLGEAPATFMGIYPLHRTLGRSAAASSCLVTVHLAAGKAKWPQLRTWTSGEQTLMMRKVPQSGLLASSAAQHPRAACLCRQNCSYRTLLADILQKTIAT